MIQLFRRSFLVAAGAAAASLAFSRARAQSMATPTPVDLTAPIKYPFAVPALPYAYDANQPSIDAQTMELHHDKHHAAYVNNLNAALKDHADLQALSLPDLLKRTPELPEAIRTTVRNNGGGHANHTMFWQVMGGKGGEPTGDIAAAITRDFGAFDKMKTDLNGAATRVFGSGWAMIVTDRDGKLSLVSKSNQDSPLVDGHAVVLGNDVWEHAYYLKYQNRRPDYLNAWWNVLDWARIDARYKAAKAGTLNV